MPSDEIIELMNKIIRLHDCKVVVTTSRNTFRIKFNATEPTEVLLTDGAASLSARSRRSRRLLEYVVDDGYTYAIIAKWDPGNQHWFVKEVTINPKQPDEGRLWEDLSLFK